MGVGRAIVNGFVWLAITTAIVSAAFLFGAKYVLKINSMTCFGMYQPTKVFVEMQAAKEVAYVFDTSVLVHEQQTAFQYIEVYEHSYFGNILVIDGSLQITQRDEVNYHEMTVHLPLAYSPNAKKAIIIGGGDGGALSRVLAHKNIETAYLIDIDMHAMRAVAQEYFPQLYAAFLDSRTKALSYDGNQWVKEQLSDPAMVGSVELIVVDSTDYGSAESLFTDEFYQGLSQLLHIENGVLVINLDSPSWNAEIVSTVQRQIARMFKYVFVYQSHQPTFLSGHYSYLFVSNNVHPMKTPVDWDAWDAKNIYTYYYTPDLHYGSFALPAAARKTYSMDGRLRDVPVKSFYAKEMERDSWDPIDIPRERFTQIPNPAADADEEEL